MWYAYLVVKSCLTLYDPLVCNLPGSSVHRILQARIMEGVTISRGSSRPRDWTRVSCVSYIAVRPAEPSEKPQKTHKYNSKNVVYQEDKQ